MFKKGLVFILLVAFLMIPFYADASGVLSKRDKQLINNTKVNSHLKSSIHKKSSLRNVTDSHLNFFIGKTNGYNNNRHISSNIHLSFLSENDNQHNFDELKLKCNLKYSKIPKEIILNNRYDPKVKGTHKIQTFNNIVLNNDLLGEIEISIATTGKKIGTVKFISIPEKHSNLKKCYISLCPADPETLVYGENNNLIENEMENPKDDPWKDNSVQCFDYKNIRMIMSVCTVFHKCKQIYIGFM